ncbi:hypothetical protein T265_12349 [Opisthorchis viverrini]|uniref:Uncharacterized protein n=1 Tax=Opisthorchis viverrini TaxID=6198 RepID=A0A074ZSE6_OPIVI|nr:hypothetical protein T265_12349 [Opisthorchis viverrini]KER18184.1 hypothetical protein T265_12349 [Opisthorchis viverrini]
MAVKPTHLVPVTVRHYRTNRPDLLKGVNRPSHLWWGVDDQNTTRLYEQSKLTDKPTSVKLIGQYEFRSYPYDSMIGGNTRGVIRWSKSRDTLRPGHFEFPL